MMINGKELTIEELAEIASKKKLRIEIKIEPNGYGQTYETIEIEPWEKYEPICPHGVPIVHTKEVIRE